MKKYFYLILGAALVAGGVVSSIVGNDLRASLSLLAAIVCLGINDILSELKKSNEGVIVRDPKTGRFTKK